MNKLTDNVHSLESGSEPQDTTSNSPNNKSRRSFLKTTLFAGAASSGIISTTAMPQSRSKSHHGRRDAVNRARYYRTVRKRFDAMISQWHKANAVSRQHTNGDEQRYADQNYYASYTKSLPHNQFGEVNREAFRKLVNAMQTDRYQDFEGIPLSASAQRNLANPEAAFLYSIEGLDSNATLINPSHTFRSAEIAAEIGELYWQAVLRDLPYNQYAIATDVEDSLTDLNTFSFTPGSKADGQITAQTLFRGETNGDIVGPYISQLLWQTVPWGPIAIEQRYQTPLSGINFMTDESNWLHIQQGALPLETVNFDPLPRYIFNHRSLGEYVHRDLPHQAYTHATMILLGYGRDAIDQGNPYYSAVTNRDPFTTFGAPYFMDLVARAANLGLSAAWYQKWAVHRFLRPEVFSGRIHFQINAKRQYEINEEILNCDALRRIYNQNGTFFLPQAFSEGSPTHPSYPAGHACVAGACSTVLKALFNENYVIPNPVVANHDGTILNTYAGVNLTIGGEINKLANNICIGRNTAGVHYRQDGKQGLRAGEQMAIAMLEDHSRLIDFDGFYLTRFDGQSIQIKNGRTKQL